MSVNPQSRARDPGFCPDIALTNVLAELTLLDASDYTCTEQSRRHMSRRNCRSRQRGGGAGPTRMRSIDAIKAKGTSSRWDISWRCPVEH